MRIIFESLTYKKKGNFNRIGHYLINLTFLLFTCFFLIVFPGHILASNPCTDIEFHLNGLKKRKTDAINSLEKNKAGLMKAEETLLLAQARGDIKAGELAKEAIRIFNKNIETNRNLIVKYDEQISEAEKLLKLCYSDECERNEESIKRTRNSLLKQIEDAKRMDTQYKDLEKNLKTLEEQRQELLRIDNILDMVINTIMVSDDVIPKKSIPKLEKIAQNLKKSLSLTLAFLTKDTVELAKALSSMDEAIHSAETMQDVLEINFEISRKFIDLGLDLDDLISKLKKTKGILENISSINNVVKATEYTYKAVALNLSSYFLGEELSINLYATEKSLEAIEALKKELKRQLEIHNQCKKIGKIKY